MPEKPTIRDILYLLTIPNIGPGRVRRLLSVFESVEEILHTPARKLIQIDGIDYKLASQLKQGGDPVEVEKQLSLIEKIKPGLLTIWDKQYPPALKKIPDPPVILFYKGKLPNEYPAAIGVVGTRTPTSYGKIVTEKLVTELIQNGITIVSGMARGIDTIAHRTAIKKSGQTFAVLGCGIDVIYPPENRPLYEEIQQHGALLSEFFLSTGPDAQNFPRRNRIISGLCQGVLVVEAGEKSGALITANYALDQNREVFAVPGNITNPKARGSNALIQQGAKLVQSVEDILTEIQGSTALKSPEERPIPPHFNNLERDILEHLTGEPKHIDRLVMELKESPALILSSLLNLELQGFVRQLSGKMFIRI